MIHNLFLILIIMILFIACTQTSKSIEKNEYIDATIQQNKIEAKKAKKVYLNLQRKRSKE